MKKILLFFIALFLAVPAFAGAHGPSDFDEIKTGPQMMQYIEDEIMGSEIHEELEDLMVKMMEGELSEQEVERLSELMQQNPGPHGMMMYRFWNDSDNDMMWNGFNRNTWGMHSGYGMWGSGWSWLGIVGVLIWLVAGIMIIVFLGKKIAEDDRKNK